MGTAIRRCPTNRLVGRRFATILASGDDVNHLPPTRLSNSLAFSPEPHALLQAPRMNDSIVASPPVSEGQGRVLDAARPLFVEHGYKGVSMQQIADAVGIHKATLYHHFRDKDDLFAAVVHEEMRQMRADMTRVIAEEDTASKRLTAVAWIFFQHNKADFGQMMTDVHNFLPLELRHEIVREQAFPWDHLELMIGDVPGMDGGQIDMELASGLFAGSIWGQIWLRKVGRVTEPLTEELAARLVDVLLAGLATSPAALLETGVGSLLQEPEPAGR
jgi:AcrR family transcriptional regulator